jgi:hypothetical protein
MGALMVLVGCGGASGTPEQQAREYISKHGHNINVGRVDYEHVALLIGLAGKGGGEEAINEVAKVAQEAHNELDSVREELFDSEASEKLKNASLELSEGANELKNAMGAIVAYAGSPNPASLAHATTQMQSAKSKWNTAVDEIWTIAGEHGAYRLK